MRFLGLLLSAVVVEIRAIFGVLPLLRRPFWIAWGLCFLPPFVGLLPGVWAVFAQLLVLIGLGLAGLFSGVMAKRVRLRKWVEYPDGPDVAPYLPQLITLLLGPPYFLAMLVLFQQAAAAFPGVLPTAVLLDAALLALDNFVRTQVFFDAAECFHLRFGARIDGPVGASIIFFSRFLMDLVFIKLAVQVLNAAYFRARGLGRGEDMLFSVKQEIEAGDVPRVKDLCQQVGDSLRDAVDMLCRYWEEGGDKAAMAWRCLVTMKDYAIPYLKTRHRSATGADRERITRLIDRLESEPAEPEVPPPTRPRLLIALAAGLLFGVTVSFVLSGTAALVVTVLMTALASWMVTGSRGWIDSLVRYAVIAPSTPDRLPRLQLRWALSLLPLLVVTWSRLFQLVSEPAPDVFSGAAVGEVNYPSTLVFVLENVLHTQIFVDTFEVYGVRIAELRQEGFLGGLLTFLLRLVLNLGMIALLVSFGMVWFNRVFRKFAVSPNAELALRKEVYKCGPQAAALIAYYLREVRGFLVEQMTRQKDEAMLVALAASGFFKDLQSEPVTGKEAAETEAARHNDLGVALWKQGRLNETVAEYQAARGIYERLVREGRDDLRNNLAMTRMNLGVALRQQGRLEESVAECQAAHECYNRLVREGRDDLRNDLAMIHSNLGVALRQQGRLEESVAEYQAAREIYERLVREGNDDLRKDLARTRMNLGATLTTQGQLDEAIAEYQAAREIFEQLVCEGRDDLRNNLAMTRMDLGIALQTQGRLEESVADFRAAREIYVRLVREGQHDLRNYLAMTHVNLGITLRQQGQMVESVADLQAGRDIYERLAREGRDDLLNDLAATRMNLGATLTTQGHLEASVAEYQAAREIYERLVREGRDDLRNNLAMTRMNLGIALRQQGHLEEAIAESQAARQIYDQLVREGQDELRNNLAMTQVNLGAAFSDQGQLNETVAEYQAALEIYERLVLEGRNDLRNNLATTRMNLGGTLRQQGRLEEAIGECQAARECYNRLVREGRDDLRNDLAEAQVNLGAAFSDQGRLEEAVAEYQAARVIYEQLVREGQFQVVAGLAICWYMSWNLVLASATKVSQQEAISFNRPAFAVLRELLRKRATLAPAALTEIGDFLRLAQESNVCADEAAVLAVQFASPTPPTG